MKAFSFIKTKLTLIVSLLIVVFILNCMKNVKQWRGESVISWDVISYYAYLPATFIYKDYTLKFIDTYKGPHKFTIWNDASPNGNKVIMTSMGMSILYSPFFFLAHLYAIHSSYDAGGYSEPYRLALMLSSVFYLLIGLIYLSKLLLKYFNPYISSIVIIFTVLGSNLFYYVTYCSPYSHPYSFALITMFIWYTIKWYEEHKIKFIIYLGLLLGIISLVRPTNILIGIFFVFWDIKILSDLRSRFQLFFKYKVHLLILVIFCCIVWFPQLLYWKSVTGQWFYYSYGESNKFFFNHPMIIKGLLGYRHGWLVYSPIMVLSVLGFFVLWKEAKQFAVSSIIFFLVFIYVIFSWWCWWYGGAFGLRAMIDIYGLTAIPMAAFIRNSLRWPVILRSVFILLTLTAFAAGIHNTDKYRHFSLHWDSNTKESFWDHYLQVGPSPTQEAKYKAPDYELARKGIDAFAKP